MGKPPQPYTTREETFEAFARHVSRGKVALYRRLGLDLVMGEREGAFFGDAFSDRRLYNCHSNGGVFNLGHRNPRVLAAVREALETLDIGNHHLVSGYRARLAERLVRTTGGRLPGVVFGVSGGEAIDLAIKVARAVTRRQTIVSAQGGYHGHTGLAMATGDPRYRDPFGPNPPGFVQVPFDDLPALERVLGDGDAAAVVLEPVPATLGMPIAAPGYLKGVQEVCRRHGARLVLDEVQTGLGRTGRIWAYQHHGLEPDVVVCGKALSGGVYPITATILSEELSAFFDREPHIHISTFGGAEPGCAAGLAVLDTIEAPGFLERVTAVSDRLAASFEGLPFTFRRLGLMAGLKLRDEFAAMLAVKALYEAGVFCVWANNDPTVVQFLPPLVLSDDEVVDLARRVRGAFGAR